MAMADTPTLEPAEPEAPKTTVYLVQVRTELDVPSDPHAVAWEDLGTLTVPRRTQGSTVLDRAGDFVAEKVGGTTPVRFRVWPAADLLEGEVLDEQPPPVRTVRPITRGTA